MVLIGSYCAVILDPKIPYNVTVRAKTSAGYGDTTSIVIFSKEGSMYNLNIIKFFKFSLFVFTLISAKKEGK